MARRYYRRRTTRPKKKWASNMAIRNYTINTSNPQPTVSLVSNATQSGTPTPVIVKAGNFKVCADVITSASTATYGQYQLMAVVLYLPEGMSINNNTALGQVIAAHPEYIMAWRQFDMSLVTSTSAGQQVTFSSRLKRNLNSGDHIVFGVLATDTGHVPSDIGVALTAQYWTCAN